MTAIPSQNSVASLVDAGPNKIYKPLRKHSLSAKRNTLKSVNSTKDFTSAFRPTSPQMQNSANLRLIMERKERFFTQIKAYKKQKEGYDKIFHVEMCEDPKLDPEKLESKLQKQMPTRKQMFAVADF